MSDKPTVGGAALGKHVANFEGLLEAMPDALVGVDQGGVIRFVNRRAEALFGYERGELVGWLIEMLMPESLRTVHQVQRDGYVAAPKTREMGTDLELRGQRRDGTEFPVDIALSHADTGNGVLVIAAVRDITDRQKTEQGRRRSERLAAVVEYSGDAIISNTPDGIITSVNPAAERMLGYSRQEIVGKSIDLLIPGDRTGEMNAILAKIRAGQAVEGFETIRVRKDGTAFPVSLTVSPILDVDGTVIGATAIPRDVTETRQAFEDAQRLAAVVKFSGEAIVSTSSDGIVTSCNPAAERLYGYSSEQMIGKSVILLSGGDSAESTGEVETALAKVAAGQSVVNFERIERRRDGTVFPASVTISPICDAAGAVVGTSAITRDVTEARTTAETARRLTAAEDLVRTVLASASIGIALADLDGSFRVVNRSLCDLLGYDEAWFLAHRLRDMVHPDDLEEALQARARVIAGAIDKSATKLRLVRADGATVWARRVAVLLHDKDGRANLIMFQVEDITAEYEAQEALTYQAFHDPLTGLHNRAWILDILAVDLRAAKRLGRTVGALFVDLDNFKVVNDSLGHAAGDEVLATVADRIVAGLRPGDRVGRFGGDEFVIVVQDLQDVLEVERCAERVSASIAVDLQVGGHRIVPTASIGIATSTSTSTTESLLRDADSALSRAKATGRASWRVFDEAMHAQAVARLTVEDELREAITAGEFVVYYQPIVALADAHVVGHEALVRWVHPTRGLLSPGEFLEVAEDSGLITAIGAQVLDQACAMLAERPELPGPISVNVPAVQLAAPGWLTSVRDTLAAHRVDPARIVIEVTETAVLSLVDSARVALETLRGIGVGIHVDDFGTGYSSISVLRDLPVTGVKLDLRFVQDLTAGDSQANALAQGVSGLVSGMHLTGIAEGIETQMQADILRAQGWECAQGYYFGRPAALPVTH
jgi:diguanylate cyclase (GGDEF)-like protein/PAS domain S-box-containing protein